MKGFAPCSLRRDSLLMQGRLLLRKMETIKHAAVACAFSAEGLYKFSPFMAASEDHVHAYMAILHIRHRTAC